jgi:transposase
VIPDSVRIFVCSDPQDIRRSFDRLAQAANEHIGEDPQSGACCLLRQQRGNRLKVLWFLAQERSNEGEVDVDLN